MTQKQFVNPVGTFQRRYLGMDLTDMEEVNDALLEIIRDGHMRIQSGLHLISKFDDKHSLKLRINFSM